MHKDTEKQRAGKICGVYSWTHRESGKKYVGSSFDCFGRRVAHLRAVKNGKGTHLHSQMRKMGEGNFTFAVVEVCTRQELRVRESFWIKQFDSVAPKGFNLHRNPEGVWDYEHTEDMRAALSERMKEFWGRPEEREAQSIRMKERMNRPENKARNSERTKQYQNRPDVKAEHSKRMKEIWNRPEVRVAQLKRMRERMNHPAVKARLSEQMKERMENPKTLAAFTKWSKEYTNRPEVKERNSKIHSKPVIQLSLTGEEIATHKSALAAAAVMRVSGVAIGKAIKRKGTSSGFRWAFLTTSNQ